MFEPARVSWKRKEGMCRIRSNVASANLNLQVNGLRESKQKQRYHNNSVRYKNKNYNTTGSCYNKNGLLTVEQWPSKAINGFL